MKSYTFYNTFIVRHNEHKFSDSGDGAKKSKQENTTRGSAIHKA